MPFTSWLNFYQHKHMARSDAVPLKSQYIELREDAATRGQHIAKTSSDKLIINMFSLFLFAFQPFIGHTAIDLYCI